MLSSIYLKTLRDWRGQILAWGIGIGVLGATNILVFPPFYEMEGLVAFMNNLPPVFKNLIGEIDAVVTLEGFLKMKLFDPLPLLLAIFAIPRAAQAITGELEHKSCDFLLAQPIRRWRVVVEKYLAIITALTILAFLLVVALLISSLFVDVPMNRWYIVRATAVSLPLSWMFAALALLGSCALPKSRHSAILAGSIVVGSYVFETLRLFSPALTRWKVVSLFAYHEAGVAVEGATATASTTLFLGLSLILILAAVTAFSRRDLFD
ncbi:MAG: ABC transporter permease subunit [bacterium]|nr:ABC transporter permease subunit [bacterium]